MLKKSFSAAERNGILRNHQKQNCPGWHFWHVMWNYGKTHDPISYFQICVCFATVQCLPYMFIKCVTWLLQVPEGNEESKFLLKANLEVLLPKKCIDFGLKLVVGRQQIYQLALFFYRYKLFRRTLSIDEKQYFKMTLEAKDKLIETMILLSCLCFKNVVITV